MLSNHTNHCYGDSRKPDAIIYTTSVAEIPFGMQALASRGILLLSSVSQGEAEAVGLAANATPVPCLDLLTPGDVGRGHQPGHHSHEGVGEHFCDADRQQGTAKGEHVALLWHLGSPLAP